MFFGKDYFHARNSGNYQIIYIELYLENLFNYSYNNIYQQIYIWNKLLGHCRYMK